jgi:hypothetical protein
MMSLSGRNQSPRLGFLWLQRLPVTQEAAGSSPVAPAILRAEYLDWANC